MKFSRIEEVAHKRGYRVDDSGTVSSEKAVNIGYINKGYHHFSIKIDGKTKNIRSHRLLAYQKYGEGIYKDGIVVRHLDGDSTNNKIDNIALGTYSDNVMDMPKHIRMARALHATSFMKIHDHDKIRAFHRLDRSYKKTMEMFDISSKGTLNFILKK
jgi:hypothetical protein